jgi:O-antigen/teichoic acid export membrane protein
MLAGFRKRLLGNGLGARLARGGSTALVIRVSSVGASYLMFVVLARNMSADDYGKFAFVFSLATLVAVIAVLGQPMLMLRLIPAYQQDDNTPLLKGLIRDSRLVVLLGSIALAALIYLGALIWSHVEGADTTYLMWAGPLVIAMAVARHQAYMMRGFGNIVLALAPRDVLWRVSVIVCTLIAARGQVSLSATYAINICSFTLIAIWVAQMFGHPSMRPATLFESGLETDRSLWTKESVGLWAVSILQSTGPNLTVVIVGFMLASNDTALFFAALKTATLLKLPLAAGGVVAAPLISRHYRAGQISDVQKISNYLVIGITVPVLLGLLLLVFFGEWILGFFGPEFVSAQPVMILIAMGTLVNALSGPTGIIMNMTGHHRQYLFIMAVTQAISLSLLPFALHYFGMMGAAAMLVAGMISWNVWVWLWSRKNLSIDPTIYGVFEWIMRARKETKQ